MTINIPDADYRAITKTAAALGISVEKYVRNLLTKKEKISVCDDESVHVLNDETVKALKESRGDRKHFLSFKNSEEAFSYLDKHATK